ncbi:endonuclease [Winogradskyella psychrotolerans]|uniref:endonuclease n=1 Tax=Winogradskyella psychrotolerans TaxID=1344585 RepID=UPI001C077033|nr:endonuclease [Winogradskyella psychrotolerans]MBU2929674.1 endonuclease [Winogradskyella psychrotolerans]
MKHIYLLLLLVSSIGFAQIPSNYYDSANGLTGFDLKTELKTIITNGHDDQGYGELYTGYATAFIDNIAETGYENDGTLLMYYTENPNGTDPYTFTLGTNQCGNYGAESDCYNREHIVPQSSFGSASPMKNDIHHVVPSDGYANGKRDNFPFGTVGSATWTSLNGSKLGSSNVSGYSGTVFEPLDEFKGDIARAILYFVTRYQDNVDGYASFEMFNGTENQALEDWAVDMLLDWHNNIDPVDQTERDRNDAAYNFQGNANPFVDHPEYVNMIWNPTPDTETPSTPTNLVTSNPTDSTIDLSWDAATDNIGVTTYDIYMDGNFAFSSNTTSATKTNLLPDVNFCFTVVAKDAAGNESDPSNESCETTLENENPDLNCITVTCENMGASAGSYTDVTWTDDLGIIWSATDARTDQTLDNRAITVRNGQLEATNISDYFDFVEQFTVTTQRVFGGSTGTFDLIVNGNVVGTIPYGDDPITTTIEVNVNSVTSLVINNNSTTSNRVMFDNLSWTCGLLSVADYRLEDINLYPNPVKNNITVDLKSDITTTIEIFDILGKRVFTTHINKTSDLNLQALKTGLYIVKMTQGDSTVTKKLIKQ